MRFKSHIAFSVIYFIVLTCRVTSIDVCTTHRFPTTRNLFLIPVNLKLGIGITYNLTITLQLICIYLYASYYQAVSSASRNIPIMQCLVNVANYKTIIQSL
jgi:hypothetical protein